MMAEGPNIALPGPEHRLLKIANIQCMNINSFLFFSFLFFFPRFIML